VADPEQPYYPAQAQAFAFNAAGGNPTSAFRDVATNRRVGGKENSWHLEGDPSHPFAKDFVPPKGQSMDAYYAQVKAANPGMFVLNEGDHIHVQPPKGTARPSAAGGGSGEATPQGPAVTAFRSAADSIGGMPGPIQMDYSGVNANLGLHQKMIDNIQADQKFTYTPPEYPDRPEPKPFEQANMAASDAAFAAATPKNPFGATPEEQDKQQLRMRRASYWAGLGQAFMNFRDGQGLGSLLANAGGAMLAGSMAGSEKVREKLEEHDRLMSQFNLQAASREGTKAANTASILNQNIAQSNTFAAQKWGDAYRDAEKFEPVYENGRVRYRTKGADGKITVTSELMDPSMINNVLSSAGGVLERRSGITNTAQQLDQATKVAEFKMLLPFAYQDAISKGDTDGAGNIQTTAAVMAAHDLVDGGTWQKELSQVPNGPQRVAQLSGEGWSSVGGVIVGEDGMPEPGQSITKDQQDRFDNYIRSNLVQQFMETQQMYRLVGGNTREVYSDRPGMPGTGVTSVKTPDTDVLLTQSANRARDRQVTRRTSTKGPYSSSSITEKE